MSLQPARAGQAADEPGRALSRNIGGLVGPTLMALSAAEFPLVQPHLYDEQIPPVVFLSGTLLFVAGLAIIRAHNRWARDWTVLVTLAGWTSVGLGLFRMFASSAYRDGAAQTTFSLFMVIEGALFCVGALLTWKSYQRAFP